MEQQMIKRELQLQQQTSYYLANKSLIDGFTIAIGVQAIIGLIAIEYAFYRVRRIINVDEKRDSQFPAFRRLDASRWSRLKFYPGALFTLPARILLLIILGSTFVLISSILTIGHDFNRGPLEAGCRKSIIGFLLNVGAYIFMFLCGIFSSHQIIDFDYTQYLGPEYQSNYPEIKSVSTVICNHVSWLDTHVLYKYYRLAFSLDIGYRRAPIMSNIANVIDSIYIPRGGTEEKRAQILQQIKERQDLIETTGKYFPLLIFPEGGTTNGSSLINFKKGAFIAEKTVRPVILKWGLEGSVIPSFDIIEMLPLVILQLSWSCMTCDIVQLPDLYPTDYLFSQHSNQGSERWEVFAWAAREIMMKAGNFKPTDIPMKEKIVYEGYMQMNPKYKSPFYLENEALIQKEKEAKELKEISSGQYKQEETKIKGELTSDYKNQAENQNLMNGDEENLKEEIEIKQIKINQL